MGAKTWMIAYCDGDPAAILRGKPALDREAGAAALAQLFPEDRFIEGPDGNLGHTNPADDRAYVAVFPGLTIVADGQLGIDYPSMLDQRFIDFAQGRGIYLHCMHSVVDWFAFAIWKNGQLVRAMSVSPDSGIMEDIGDKLAWEAPFWAGERPAVDPADMEEGEEPYPLPFHPLEMAEVALKNMYGYVLEGELEPGLVEPEDIPLMRFTRDKAPRKAAWWKFW